MDTASHGGKDEADKWKLTVAWLRTITWIPRPCSRMSSSNTCRASNTNALYSTFKREKNLFSTKQMCPF